MSIDDTVNQCHVYQHYFCLTRRFCVNSVTCVHMCTSNAVRISVTFVWRMLVIYSSVVMHYKLLIDCYYLALEVVSVWNQ